jgi:alkylation response protein AidB-like acyl-CoA dehydrogenase
MILTQDQIMVRDAVADFCKAEIAPRAADWDLHHTFPHDIHRQLGALGCYGVMVPEAYGGAGLDAVSLSLIIEEIAAADGGTSTAISVNNCPVCSILQAFGTEEQKKTFLMPLAQGTWLGAFCLTEPQAGSNAAEIRCTARRDGDDYVLSGVKQFITSGKNAQVAIVIAVTGEGPPNRRMSAFIVPTDTPGYVVARLEEKIGQHSSDTAQIIFEDCRIPARYLIGEEGQGYKIALSGLEGGRIGIASQSVGMARGAFTAALAYAQDRQAFGKPLFDHQAVQFRLADMATELEAARQLIWHAASLKDAGHACMKEAAMAKLFASEVSERVCSHAIQVLGGYGVVRDFPVERFYRDVRVCQIYEGTSDIQKIIIGRALRDDGGRH